MTNLEGVKTQEEPSLTLINNVREKTTLTLNKDKNITTKETMNESRENFDLPDKVREIKWIDKVREIYTEIDEVLNIALEKEIITPEEKENIIQTLELAGKELMKFDSKNPLPDFHDATDHSLGGIKLILETLIGANISAETMQKAILAQSFHDLGYGKELDLDERSYRTRLGINNTHEDRSIVEAINILEKLNYSKSDIEEIIYMINATKFSINKEALENHQTYYKNNNGEDQLIDITNHSNKYEIILSSRAMAVTDMYKIEKHFIDATKKLNKEFLGDIIFLIEKLGLNKTSKYEDCFQIFKDTYSKKERDPKDPIVKNLKEPELEPTIKDIESALEILKEYTDENGNTPFKFEPFAISETFQIANTKNYMLFNKNRLEEMDTLKYCKNLYKDEENPIDKQALINEKIINAYIEATKEIYNKLGNSVPISLFDEEVDRLVLKEINKIYTNFNISKSVREGELENKLNLLEQAG